MHQRTFLVTGASKGIGLGLSTRLANAGHRVVGIARGSSPDVPGRLISVDLGDSNGSAQALADLVRDYSFDGVINNVGLARLKPLGDIKLDELEEVLRLTFAQRFSVQATLPSMLRKGWGGS